MFRIQTPASQERASFFGDVLVAGDLRQLRESVRNKGFLKYAGKTQNTWLPVPQGVLARDGMSHHSI